MERPGIIDHESRKRLYLHAFLLAQITIIYNLVEGLVSVWLGLADETLSLAGFGLDSFVEVMSGVGILHMVRRLMRDPNTDRDQFEKTALRITGTAFYILAAGLLAGAGVNTYQGNKPVTTFWGIVIALISILTMTILIYFKLKVGRKLNSAAIVADANCTRACLYLSVILLLASTCYELTGIGGVDSLGAVLISFFAFKEGKESFEKAGGKTCSCGQCD